MESGGQVEIEQVMNDFIRTTTDLKLAQFLNFHRMRTVSTQVSDQDNKEVLVLASIGSLVLIFDMVEDEFGLACQTPSVDTVNNVELIGDLEPSLREMVHRMKY
jgi:hypothetical protein